MEESISKIFQKVLNDDVEKEALDYITQEINKEMKKPESEIDLDRVCALMYEKIQIRKIIQNESG